MQGRPPGVATEPASFPFSTRPQYVWKRARCEGAGRNRNLESPVTIPEGMTCRMVQLPS